MSGRPIEPDDVQVVRRGPGANCSSIGSALDVIFLSALGGAALLATIAALFRAKEDGGSGPPPPASPPVPPTDPRGEADDEASPTEGGESTSGHLRPRVRLDRDRAWVRWSDELLVALDRRAAERAGLAHGSTPLGDDRAPPPLEAHVAVTSKCSAGCTGCYVDARPDGESPPFEELAERLRALADAGVFTVAFGGGEPLSRTDLGELATLARSLGLVPVLTTSGLGLTPDRARSLRPFAQVNVSYDGVGEDYRAVRGYAGAHAAERAMAALRDAGVSFGANVVLTRDTFDRLEATCAALRALGAREAQLLRYKPSGRARDVSYLARRLSPDQIAVLAPTLEAITARVGLPLRVDCALVPLLSASPLDPEQLARFGVFGCEAAGHLVGVTVDGRVSPCSFGPASAVEVGAVRQAGWSRDATLEGWRRAQDEEPCATCSLATTCRGGCRVVASYLTGRLGADPECPRVRAWSARSAR